MTIGGAGNAERFSAKAREFQAALAQIPDWTIDSIGAFFAYVRHPFEGTSSLDIAKQLATRNGLLLIPGMYFGPDQDRHLRVSFGNLSAESLADLPERFRLHARSAAASERHDGSGKPDLILHHRTRGIAAHDPGRHIKVVRPDIGGAVHRRPPLGDDAHMALIGCGGHDAAGTVLA